MSVDIFDSGMFGDPSTSNASQANAQSYMQQKDCKNILHDDDETPNSIHKIKHDTLVQKHPKHSTKEWQVSIFQGHFHLSSVHS